MKKIIIANWKMNPATGKQALRLFRAVSLGVKNASRAEVIIAPPFIYLSLLRGGAVKLGAQDVFWAHEGAYTGEISVYMLKSLKVKYVIVGHSERREHLNETDEMVNKKVKTVLKAGLKTVLCVGEKDRADENFQNFVREELKKDLKGVSQKAAKNLIIAYEPIWAIGTGRTVKPTDLFEMATFIRRSLLDILGKRAAYGTPILYGGSIDAKNAGQFLTVDGVNGLLVGGASLSVKEFLGIVNSVR